MKFLLLNTCGLEGVVALAEEGCVLGVETVPGRGTSETLMPAIRKLLLGAAVSVRDLSGVGVVHGPGSFTGIRVGLSAAKGLCEVGGVGLIAMSRLGLVAAQRREAHGLALLDAGRGEYYCGAYGAGPQGEEDLLTLDEARGWMQGRESLTCEERVADRLGIRLVEEPGAEQMLTTMRSRVGAGEWTDVASADANYLRRTDAELLRLRDEIRS